MDWLKILIFTVLLFGVIALMKAVLRKALNIEKQQKELFSYNYITDSHKKVDRIFRFCSTILYLFLTYLILFEGFSVSWYFAALMLFTAVGYLISAYFEWKGSDDPKQSILTVSEMAIIVLGIMAIFQFDVLNLF